jgi:hypothetical protein
LYLVVSGWLWIRPASPSTRLRRARWVGGLGLLVSLLLVYGAVVTPGFRAVLAVFAGILLALCTGDLFRSPQADQAPRLHAARMGGAFIAATTAFAVVNIDFLPGPVVWLTPSAVGALAIARATSRFYQKDS